MTNERYRFDEFVTNGINAYGDSVSWTHVHRVIRDKAIGPGHCWHWECTPADIQLDYTPAGLTRIPFTPINDNHAWHGTGFFGYRYQPYDIVSSALKLYRDPGLNRNKLDTTSDFGLLQAIAELDDTIAMFTRRFWQSLSYGSITWGLLPFVSEVQALADQAKSVLDRAPKNFQLYEDQETQSVDTIINMTGGYTFRLTGEWTTRYTGSVTIDVGFLLELYDRLGFHPDILTVWDLVPLSFLVDWVVDVGGFLEGVTNRGWIRAANFSGWKTRKFTGTFTGIDRTDHGILYHDNSSIIHEVKIFERSQFYASPLLDTSRPEFNFGLSWPSLKNLFDAGYIFGAFR